MGVILYQCMKNLQLKYMLISVIIYRVKANITKNTYRFGDIYQLLTYYLLKQRICPLLIDFKENHGKDNCKKEFRT